MKGWASKLILGVFGTGIGLLGAEVLIRTLDSAPQVGVTSFERYRLSPNPRIGYEPSPNVQLGEDRSNALGYRGPVYSQKPSSGVFRILVVGDSVSEGLLIQKYSDVWPAVVERELRRAALVASRQTRAVEVLNFGVNVYNTGQEVETLRDKGMRFSPHLIVLQYALNDDHKDDGGIARQIVERAKDRPFIEKVWDHPILLHSGLYRFLKYIVLRESSTNKWTLHWTEMERIGSNRVGEYLKILREVVHGVPVVVVIFPWFQKGLGPYPFLDRHAELTALARAEQFDVIDLLPTFQRCAAEKKEPVNLDHVHPSVFGHLCAGTAVAARLAETLP